MITKRINLTLLAIFCYSFSIACSFSPNDFCRTYVNSPDNPTIVGKITAIYTFGIDLEVIEILRGEEDNSVIRIWSGTDFDCNGLWSMAASDIGALNDTVIIILDEIIELENDWDIIGDYRRRHPYNATTELEVKNGIVNGFLSGDPFAPPSYNLLELEYELFKQQLIIEGGCPLTVNTQDIDQQLFLNINNPFTTELRIQVDQMMNNGLLKIYSITGQIVHVQDIDHQTEINIDTNNLPANIYFLEIQSNGRQREIIKLVKH